MSAAPDETRRRLWPRRGERAGDDRQERRLVSALKKGDERAFLALVDRHSSALLRLARMYVSSRAVAEEVVQETWLGVLKGIDRFEERSSLSTWIYRILVNTAKTRGERESRSLPFSAVAGADEPTVDPDRFFPPDDPSRANGWALGPARWPTPEEELAAGETREVILRAIEALAPGQRQVITLRDLEGWPSQEVCNALEISETNQRVLLHRARAKVRTALERHFDAVEPTV
jgi:RNA polymerase sigma-70 factor (ECF subfamily)